MDTNSEKHYHELGEELREYFAGSVREVNWVLDMIGRRLSTYRLSAHAWAEDRELRAKVGDSFTLAYPLNGAPIVETTGHLFAIFGWAYAQHELATKRETFLQCVKYGQSPEIEAFYEEFKRFDGDNEMCHTNFLREIMWGTPIEEGNLRKRRRRSSALEFGDRCVMRFR